ncbi:MAG TPA: tetratricopeptide repeat protein [Kofleriaceae bacterium]|nr:tetratricopeptide repeat protein [Kofleriaceae bacterium]
MIEVTCGACGTVHRFAESDAGRTQTCTACKAKIVVPALGAKKPLGAGPSLAAFDAPEAAGGTGDIIDLAELPAPKRASPLAGAAGAGSKPAPKSALSGAAPSKAAPPPRVNDPLRGAASTPGSALDLGDINLGLDLVPPGETDLPAPVGPSPTKAATPAKPAGATPAIPKIPPIGAPAVPKIPPIGPATKTGMGPGMRPGVTDLPAPKRSATPAAGVPAGVGGPGVTDLPAPKRSATPAAGVPTSASTAAGLGLTDLPAPKRPGGPGVTDLPAPKRASGAAAPAASSPPPKPAADLGGGIDLPAPKGFFDDLPAPVGATPSAVTDLPAPKGFFDDLPQPSSHAPASARGPAKDDLLAPKGFFDDLPQPSSHAPASDAAKMKDLPAPKGFFDDIPAPPATIKGDTIRPGKPLDLDDLELAPHSQVGPLPTAPPLDLEPMPMPAPMPMPTPPPARVAKPGTVPPPAGRNVPALELPDAGGDPYGGLDLPPPNEDSPLETAPHAPAHAVPPSSGGVVSFKPAPKSDEAVVISAPPANTASLDLDIETAAAKARGIAPTSTQLASIPARAARDDKKEKAKDAKPETSQRRKTIALAALLGVAAAGAGAFFYYKHYKKGKARGQQLEGSLATARSELASGAAGHWARAATQADNALAADPKNTDALALSAEAWYGGLLDEGTNAKTRGDTGAQRAQTLIEAAANGPDVDKALALKLLVDGGADRAAQRLAALVEHAPNDGDALLFLGWAHLGAHAWKDAIADFDRALKASPARDVPALYGRAQAKLALGDRDGARADFDAVLAKDHDHVGAQVGQAAAAPASSFEQRDTQLAALLGRKDIDKADPRAVALAWTLWGDDARLAGRLDAAGDRYKHALELDPQLQQALIGQADLAVRGGRMDVAKDLIDRALRKDPDDVDANLLAAQIALSTKQADDAMKLLDKLAARTPPIELASQKARMLLLRGNGLEQQGKLDDALDAYKAAAAAAGDSDVGPTIAAVELLNGRVKDAEKAKNAADAAKYRQAAEDLLAPLAAKAQSDPAMAVTLGVAYMQSGAPDKAEPFLQAAVNARPKDPEALFQLATAQAQQGKRDASLATRQRAFDVNPTRLDIGGALAHDYEDAGKDDKAGEMYDKLVASPDVTADIRERAGRFWARTGDMKKAGAQGELLLKDDPENAAGLYLQAEGLLADGKLDLARRTFQKASDYDAQAQYLDGLGRADEALWRSNDDTRFQEDAIRAYARATELDPKMFTPLLGRGRLMVERADYAKALEPLNAARELKPNDGEVAYYLGVALHGAGRDREAIAWLIKANQVKPRAEGYKLLGEIYANNDQAGPAADALARAVAMAKVEEDKGGHVDWLTDVLYEQILVANSRNDLGTVKRAGQAFLDRSPKDQNKVSEVQHMLLGIH